LGGGGDSAAAQRSVVGAVIYVTNLFQNQKGICLRSADAMLVYLVILLHFSVTKKVIRKF